MVSLLGRLYWRTEDLMELAEVSALVNERLTDHVLRLQAVSNDHDAILEHLLFSGKPYDWTKDEETEPTVEAKNAAN